MQFKKLHKGYNGISTKLNKIPQPLPGNYIMFYLDVKAYTQVFQERKQGSRVKRHYKSVKSIYTNSLCFKYVRFGTGK
jgi:hypothetical protein